MSTAEPVSSSLSTRLGDVSNVLLLVGHDDERAEEGCMELLSSTPLSNANVLCVTAVSSPDERVAAWDAHLGDDRPAKVGFIDVGATTRGGSPGIGDPTDPFSVHTIEHPADLIGIEINRSRYQSAWAGDDNQLVVCVDSLNSLLDNVSLERAFRFLNALTGRFRAADAIAHYHLDPSGYDERTLNTIKGLFDAVVEPHEDGEWRTRVR